MEVFSLLKYWRGGGGAKLRATNSTNLRQPAIETDEDDEDEGSFFDLKLTLPDDEEQDNEETDSVDDADDGDCDSAATTDGEREFNFTVSSGSSCCVRTDPNLSPSDDLFFKGRLVPIEPSSLGLNSSEPNSKTQFPVSFIKSATKFRVFKFGLKKPKSSANTDANDLKQPQQQEEAQAQQKQQQSKLFTVKLKVEEVPIVSLFTRDNSSRSSGNKIEKQSSEEIALEEKKFAKDVLQKYLKMIKPLYVRVSKRYGEKLKFSGQLSLGLGKIPGSNAAISSTPISSPTKNEVDAKVTEGIGSNAKNMKQGNLPAGLRVVCKHLGKSRSASSAVAAVTTVPIQAKRRDDSLLQQQDGIQSAILHCKRSFNASKDLDSSLLTRSTSNPSDEKSIDTTIHSSEEAAKESRI